MALSVAPLYAALLGFLYLSIRVIRLRRRSQGNHECPHKESL